MFLSPPAMMEDTAVQTCMMSNLADWQSCSRISETVPHNVSLSFQTTCLCAYRKTKLHSLHCGAGVEVFINSMPSLRGKPIISLGRFCV